MAKRKLAKKVPQFAHQIWMLRHARRLTQVELSELAGVSRLSIVKIEQGSTGGTRVLEKVERALANYDPEEE